MHERASERDFQTFALRVAFGASTRDSAKPETLDQLVRHPIELGPVQAVQFAVVADVLAAGEMRIQAARARQDAERSANAQRLRYAIMAIDDGTSAARA